MVVDGEVSHISAGITDAEHVDVGEKVATSCRRVRTLELRRRESKARVILRVDACNYTSGAHEVNSPCAADLVVNVGRTRGAVPRGPNFVPRTIVEVDDAVACRSVDVEVVTKPVVPQILATSRAGTMNQETEVAVGSFRSVAVNKNASPR